MEKKTKKRILSMIMGLIVIICLGVFHYFGFISGRFGAHGGFHDRARMHEWDLSLSSFSGTVMKPVFPENGFLQLTSAAVQGTLSVTVKSGRKVIYEMNGVESESLILPVPGRVTVSVKAEHFSGDIHVTAGVTEPVSAGNIYLYGEAHSDVKILEMELEIWKEYYDSGMRDLFIEHAYYTAQFMNLWMHSDDDTIFNELFSDWEGTQDDTPQVKEFYQTIKRECPETVFHGTDVGHQYDTTGARYLKYLLDNGYAVDSEEYILANKCIEQGRKYYGNGGGMYREIQMLNNFISEYESMGGKSVMGIFGSAHTDPAGMDYMTGTVPCMGNALGKIYKDKVNSVNLCEIVRSLTAEPVSEEIITINGKEYAASYFGSMDLSAVLPGYRSRDVWRIEGAYEDFKNVPVTGNVLPYDNYPMNIEPGQIYKLVYTMDDGSTFTEYHRFDGNEWQGKSITEQMDLQ